jgi:hypothetical protein
VGTRPANQPAAWRPHWLRLLRQIRPAIPSRLTVIVLADRGLYARWLFRRIRRLGWHPFLRVNAQGTFRPACARAGRRLRVLSGCFVPRPGTTWQGAGVAFTEKHSRLSCTLLACWQEAPARGYPKGPWLILTDLPPEAAEAGWYGLRAWIEQGFKRPEGARKRAGWQWQRTRMEDPDRAARLWLAVAGRVPSGCLWMLLVGGEADDTIPDSTLLDLTPTLATQRRQRQHPHAGTRRLRLVSCFRRGWTRILVALLNHQPLPWGTFNPNPWPPTPGPIQLPLPGLDDDA